MKPSLIVLLSALALSNLPAQADAQAARDLYIQATEAMGQGRSIEAVGLLKRAIQEMGSTNLRLQSALVQALAGQESDSEFEAEYSILENFRQSQPFDLPPEVAKRHANIVSANLLEEDDWRSAQRKNTEVGYSTYLSQHPKGRYASVARSEAVLARQREAQAAKDEADRQARLREQLAREQAERKDREDYENATRRDALEWYLRMHPNGIFQAQAKESIRTKRLAACEATIATSRKEIEERKGHIVTNRLWMLLMLGTTGAGVSGVVYGLPMFYGSGAEEIYLGALIAFPSGLVAGLSGVSFVNTWDNSSYQEREIDETSRKIETLQREKADLDRKQSTLPAWQLRYTYAF